MVCGDAGDKEMWYMGMWYVGMYGKWGMWYVGVWYVGMWYVVREDVACGYAVGGDVV